MAMKMKIFKIFGKKKFENCDLSSALKISMEKVKLDTQMVEST